MEPAEPPRACDPSADIGSISAGQRKSGKHTKKIVGVAILVTVAAVCAYLLWQSGGGKEKNEKGSQGGVQPHVESSTPSQKSESKSEPSAEPGESGEPSTASRSGQSANLPNQPLIPSGDVTESSSSQAESKKVILKCPEQVFYSERLELTIESAGEPWAQRVKQNPQKAAEWLADRSFALCKQRSSSNGGGISFSNKKVLTARRRGGKAFHPVNVSPSGDFLTNVAEVGFELITDIGSDVVATGVALTTAVVTATKVDPSKQSAGPVQAVQVMAPRRPEGGGGGGGDQIDLSQLMGMAGNWASPAMCFAILFVFAVALVLLIRRRNRRSLQEIAYRTEYSRLEGLEL